MNEYDKIKAEIECSEAEKENIFGDFKEGRCESCGETCVNQFLPENESILLRWRAKEWKDRIICCNCADDELDK